MVTGPSTASEEAGASAQTPPPPGSCTSSDDRQLDFWLGDWEVFGADGNLAGRNTISLVAGGCALLERWQGARGGEGSSLTYYDPAIGRWRQNWVGLGLILDLRGGWDGERMLLQGGERAGPDGPLIDRIGWTPLGDGEVLQTWEVSRDGGATWTTIFEGTYRPRVADEPTPSPAG